MAIYYFSMGKIINTDDQYNKIIETEQTIKIQVTPLWKGNHRMGNRTIKTDSALEISD